MFKAFNELNSKEKSMKSKKPMKSTKFLYLALIIKCIYLLNNGHDGSALVGLIMRKQLV